MTRACCGLVEGGGILFVGDLVVEEKVIAEWRSGLEVKFRK
jgi:hypothetical protein